MTIGINYKMGVVSYCGPRRFQLKMATSLASHTLRTGFKLSVLSWNINGLDPKNLETRTQAVVDLINQRAPHVVFLQEVVSKSLSLLQRTLGTAYSVHFSPPNHRYFPAVLVTKSCPKIVIDGEIVISNFPGSKMDRHLLQLFINVCGVPIALYTSHLESEVKNTAERKKQLKTCFESIDAQQRGQRSCIFGGDLNVKDVEITKVGLPQSTVDMWQACGSVKEHEYTWDISANDNLDWPFDNEPRLRYDRLYLTVNDGGFVRPNSFELVGKERILSCNRFPSDHWGMFAVFELVVIED